MHMKSAQSRSWIPHACSARAAVAIALVVAGLTGGAQQKARLAGDGRHHRRRHLDPLLALDQINASNFNTLKVAWEWHGDDRAAGVELGDDQRAAACRSTSTACCSRSRARAAPWCRSIPATGKTLWTFQEPPTPRHEYSMRSNHGKGVAYAQINGRGVVLRHDARLLPARARRQDRQADRRLGRAGAGARLPARPARSTC